MLGAELAAADDTAAAAELSAAAPASEADVEGLFNAVPTAMTMTSAPNAMSPESALCRAGQDLRFRPLGVCGGMADCCGCGASC